MTYREFRETYKYMIKNYPMTAELWQDNPEKNITLTTVRFMKVGTQWKETERKTEKVDFITYANIFDAIPFFKGLGGREIVSKSYTSKGYIPTELNSINPTRTEKTLRIFEF